MPFLLLRLVFACVLYTFIFPYVFETPEPRLEVSPVNGPCTPTDRRARERPIFELRLHGL